MCTNKISKCMHLHRPTTNTNIFMYIIHKTMFLKWEKKGRRVVFFCYLLLFFFMGLIPLAGRAEVRVDLPTSRAQIFSWAWSASGRYFCFLQQNISQRAGARLVSTTKNLIKWRHFGANYLNTGDKTKSKYSPQKKKIHRSTEFGSTQFKSRFI